MDRIGIIMHGVTGRMGYNQHLVRSILAIRDQGGVELADGRRLQVDPIIVGRNAEKMEALAKQHGIARWGTDLDAALANPDDTIFFDAGTTLMRAELLSKALDAGKHVYCEKPISDDLGVAVALAKKARGSGLKHGVVQDKLFLPGPAEARASCATRASSAGCSRCAASSATGCSRATGASTPQRPSWNYRKGDGGGIILDMLCHWRYVIDGLFGEVKAVSCLGATHIPERIDEQGKPYTGRRRRRGLRDLRARRTASSRSSTRPGTVRVRRDDLVTFQVDGTHGSAVAGLTKCWTQHRVNTPKPVWNPDQPQTMNFFDQWEEVPDTATYDNGFKAQWEMFLRHVAEDGPWPYGLEAGAKGVQLAELGLKSWAERRWLDVPALEY